MTAQAEIRQPGVLRHRRRTGIRSRLGLAILLIAATVAVLLPFIWVISLSFTPNGETFGEPSLIPAHPTFENYVTAFVDANLGRALINSAIVATTAVLTNSLFAVMAGYAFAMLPFPGHKPLFYLLMATAAIPGAVTMIPLFLIARGIPLMGGNDILGHGGTGLLNTLAGVVLPYLVGPMSIFLARQFFTAGPKELAEAARVDGASELRIFFSIYVPLSRPLIAVVAIFAFVAVWDDFLWPLVVTNTPAAQTVQLALTRFMSDGNIQFGPLMAGTIIATLPVLIVFLFNQRSFISGLNDGAIKG